MAPGATAIHPAPKPGGRAAPAGARGTASAPALPPGVEAAPRGAPPKKVLIVWAARWAVSPALTRKSYLPAASPAVRRMVAHTDVPPNGAADPLPIPAGATGTGAIAVHRSEPEGA